MGIDYAAWRTRTGLNNYRQCRYYHPLPVQCRAARWGVGEVMNDTPLVLQGCIVVVSLSLILEYGIHSWRGSLKGRGGCDKVRCSKFGGGSVLSGETRGMVGVASGIHLLLQVCLVMLALLLMAGDVERNPGPTTKEGSLTPTAQLFKIYFSKLAAAILDPERLANELYSKDLVSAGVRNEMTVIGQSSYHKTTRLLSAVECQIEMNPDSLHTFLSVLREDPSLVYLADAMSDEYRLLSPPKSADTCLPSLSQLSAELSDFEHWYLLGLQLNISKDILDCIERTHETKVRQCIEMIQHWITNAKTPTWGTVHEALRNIGENNRAARIANKYDIQPSSGCEGNPKSKQSTSNISKEMSLVSMSNVCRVDSTSEESLRSETSSNIVEERSVVPGLKQSDHGKGKSTSAAKSKHLQIITREKWRISTYFATTIDRITILLEKHIPLEKLVQFLHFQCHPLFPGKLYVDQQILQGTSSISDIMRSLVPDYINYMETGLLEAILERFEVEPAQKLLQEYHDHYPHLRQLSEMPDPVPDERLDLTRRKRLRAKCDGDFESTRANNVKRIRMSIESATGIDHRFVTPAQHSEGSLILTFLIPESVTSIFQELCDEDLEILAESGILQLQIDDFVICNIQEHRPQRSRSSAQSTSVPSAGQAGITNKGFDSYIEQREEQFTSEEKSQITGLLNHVPNSVMEEVCTDSFLQQLAPHMTDWRKLAPRFGISELGAELLTHHYPDMEEQKYRALYLWKQISPGTATYGSLFACLLAHAPFLLAEAAVKIITPDAAVQETRKLLQEAYLLQESQPLWSGAPALLQFDRRLGRVTEDTPNSEQFKDMDYSSQFEMLEQFSSEVEILSIKSFLNLVVQKKECFFFIKGPPVSGKSALLQRVCAFWARGFCLRKFALVLWLGLNTYPSIPSDASLRAILRYCLPQHSDIDSIEQWVVRHEAEDVLVVVDGVDNQGKHFMENVVALKTLKKATIILAASGTLMQHPFNSQTQYHLLGLSEEQIFTQVIHHYHHNTSRAEEFLMYISEARNIRSLCSSPPYLATVLFVFDSVDTSDLPRTWTQLFTRLLRLLRPSSDFPKVRTQSFTGLLRLSSVSNRDTLVILTSKAYAVTSTKCSFDWHHRFINFCTRITSPYRTMVAPADHCCFTLTLFQHYLCARHIHSLPRDQHVTKLNRHTVPFQVRQFYIGLCSSFKGVKMVLKYPDALISTACMLEALVEGLQDLMSSQATFKYQCLTAVDIHSIFQAVYHSGLPCKLQFYSCHFGPRAMETVMKGLPILPSGGTVQELSLTHNSISGSGVHLLADALKVNQSLQKLDLSHNNISNSGAYVTAGALKVNQSLQKLNLSHNNISDPGAYELARALTVNQNLQKLIISHNYVSDSGACMFAATLKVNQSLQKLNLSHNTISDRGAYVLAGVLQVYQSLQELNLYQNKISVKGFHVLTGAWQLDQRLQRLVHAESKTTGKGASTPARTSKVKRRLQELDLHNCDISDEGVYMLAGVLQVNRSLQKLDLSQNYISDDGVNALCGALKVNWSLQKLELSQCNISDNGVHSLSRTLKVNQSLQNLDLSHNNISDSGACVLAEVLKVNHSIQKLDLSHNIISDNGAYVLATVLQVSQSLQELHLYQNNISESGSRILTGVLQLDRRLQGLVLEGSKTSDKGASIPGRSLKVKRRIQELDLSQSYIADDAFHALSEALKVNRSLQKLDLSGTYISGDGVLALSGALKVNQSLQILNLSESNISVDGALALSEALKVNHSLQRLNLNENKISDNGAYALFSALKVSRSLQNIDLRGNNISDDGACALSRALEVNRSLHEMDLSWNKISKSGAHALSTALKVNRSLQELDLGGNRISDDGVHALSEALKVTQSLRKLNLSQNDISDIGAHELSGSLKINRSLHELDLQGNYISSEGRSALFEAEHKKNLEIDLGHQFRRRP